MKNKTYVCGLNFCLGLFLLIYITIGNSLPVMAEEFPDVRDNWARMEIACLKAANVLTGYPDALFHPDSSISRAEFSKLIIAALGESDEAEAMAGCTPAFTDFSSAYWANGYISLGEEQGIFQGKGDYFDPEASISRQEIACVMSRVSGSSDVQEEESVPFTDVEDIADWALDDVSTLYHLGLLKGFPDDSFRPGEVLTRAEAAVILYRLINEKGLLSVFNGILKKADLNEAVIILGNREELFKIAERPGLFENGRAIDSLTEYTNVRISFIVNSSGEIEFGRLSYEDSYLNVNVKQVASLQDLSQPSGNDGFAVSGLSSLDYNNEANSLNEENNGDLLMQLGQEKSGISEIKKSLDLSGAGVVIAVIDSGIDPLGRDFQRTEHSDRKIIDWVNFTGEGRVKTALFSSSNNGVLDTERGQIILHPSVKSVSGQYKYGYWNEEWISFTQAFDYTGNNKQDDQILVMVLDSKEAGIYDRVFVDTNNNSSLADEIPLQVFRELKYSYASFPPTADLPAGFPFVLCDILADGSEVVFGYDSEGHGTHVAGIAAGSGEIQGIAPNAQLMVLKVADATGAAKLEDTMQAVEYAVSKGADIINISLAFYPEDDADLSRFRNKLDQIARNTLICTATGNNGPGLSTLAVPGDTANVLSVGAYISPEMWEAAYGWKVEKDSIYYFNSIGPGEAGALKPDLLAPGVIVSSYPGWTGRSSKLNEGSSMAAAYVSGTAAILMEAMLKKGQGFNSQMIKEALIKGAEEIEGVYYVEQGHGVLDAGNSWMMLKDRESLPKYKWIETDSALFPGMKGILARGVLPGIDELRLENRSAEEVQVSWISHSDWMKIEQGDMRIPVYASRNLEVRYEVPDEPGLYCALLEGQTEDGSKIEMLHTLIVPEKWDINGESTSYHNLAAGQIERYYYNVPPGSRGLELKLKILGSLSHLQGRARMYIYDPEGKLYNESGYAGAAAKGLEEQREVMLSVDNPLPGNWEVVVYSSATLSNFNLKESDYVLTASLMEGKNGLNFVDNEFIVGCGQLRDNTDSDTIFLAVLDAGSKQPYNGHLIINDRLYYVNKGKVKIFSNIERQTLELIIRKEN